MTHQDDPDCPDDSDDARNPRGFIRSLLALLQEMDERGEQHRSGQGRVGRNVSFDYSVGIGGLSSPKSQGLDGKSSDRPNQSQMDDHPYVTTRETAEGIVVAADLPGVGEEDIETRFEGIGKVLVVEIDGQEGVRLPLEDGGWTVVESRFANGVLEVRLRRD